MCKAMTCDGRCRKPNQHKYTMSYATHVQYYEAIEDRLQRIELLLAHLVAREQEHQREGGTVTLHQTWEC